MTILRLVFLCFTVGFLTTATPALASPVISSQGEALSEVGEDTPVILFLGNSLTAGYQLRPSQAFPALIQEKIDALVWKFKVVNAGLSGETSAGGLRRIDWVMRQRIDILVLELGANDALRGIPLDVTEANLQGIIDKVRQKNPKVRVAIAGMQVPPILGQEYTEQFRSIFPGLAQRNQAGLIPFLLEGVAGIVELNLGDGYHPNPEGHEIVAETVWEVLKPILEE